MTTDQIKRALQNLSTTYKAEIITLVDDLSNAQIAEITEKLIERYNLPDFLPVPEDDGVDVARLRSVADIKDDITKRETALPKLDQLINEHQALVEIKAGIDKS